MYSKSVLEFYFYLIFIDDKYFQHIQKTPTYSLIFKSKVWGENSHSCLTGRFKATSSIYTPMSHM